METVFTRRLTYALAFAGLALAAWQGLVRAEEGPPAAASSLAVARSGGVDEAVGAPGRDPYAFYVFNRHDPSSDVSAERLAVATARPRPDPFASVPRRPPRSAPTRPSAD